MYALSGCADVQYDMITDPIEMLRRYVIDVRAKKRLSQRDVAKAGNISVGTVANLEAGSSTMPKPSSLKGLAKGLGVPYRVIELISTGTDPYIAEGMAEDEKPVGQLIDKLWQTDPELADKLQAARDMLKSGGSNKVDKTRILVDTDLLVSLVRLPVYGDVSCGWGAAVEDEPIDWKEWPAAATLGADHLVTVRGDSMRDVGITAGSLLFVKKAPKNWRKEVPSGKTVIARFTDDDTYTCKILERIQTSGRDSITMLQGSGPGFEKPLTQFDRPFEVVGVVTLVAPGPLSA
jgi:transcriptional regulator with XRE-family HTH domain